MKLKIFHFVIYNFLFFTFGYLFCKQQMQVELEHLNEQCKINESTVFTKQEFQSQCPTPLELLSPSFFSILFFDFSFNIIVLKLTVIVLLYKWIVTQKTLNVEQRKTFEKMQLVSQLYEETKQQFNNFFVEISNHLANPELSFSDFEKINFYRKLKLDLETDFGINFDELDEKFIDTYTNLVLIKKASENVSEMVFQAKKSLKTNFHFDFL